MKCLKAGMVLTLLMLVLFWGSVYSASPDWESLFAPGLKTMVKSKKYENTYLSEMEESGKFDLANFDGSAYVSGLPQARKIAHGMMNITGYKITQSKIVRRTDSFLIEIEGSFLRAGLESVHFCEVHQFKAQLFNQRQLNLPASVAKRLFAKPGDCFEVLHTGLENLK
jgi:hypothetical protein